MRKLPLLLVVLAAYSKPVKQPFDAEIAFAVTGGPDAKTPALTTVSLAARKQGRTPIVDAWQDDAGSGEQYGRHKFPPGCSAAGIAGYYQGLLGNAGWTGADFEVKGARIRLFGVEQVACTADDPAVVASVDRSPL